MAPRGRARALTGSRALIPRAPRAASYTYRIRAVYILRLLLYCCTTCTRAAPPAADLRRASKTARKLAQWREASPLGQTSTQTCTTRSPAGAGADAPRMLLFERLLSAMPEPAYWRGVCSRGVSPPRVRVAAAPLRNPSLLSRLLRPDRASGTHAQFILPICMPTSTARHPPRMKRMRQPSNSR